MSKAYVKFKIDKNDPIGRFLFKKLGLSTMVFVFIALLIAVFEYFIIPWGNGSPPSRFEYLFYFLLNPIIWFYYSISCNRIPNLFNDIRKSGVFDETNTQYHDIYYSKIERSYNSPLWLVVIISSSLLTITLLSVSWKLNPDGVSWFYNNTLHLSFVLIFIFVNGYFGFFFIFRELLTVYWIHRLFSSFQVHIHPLDPDGAGGLGFIGIYYMGLTLFIVAIALALSAGGFFLSS